MNTTNKDYYAILGLPKTATQDEIKSAYRKLAMKWHPDHNPDNPEAKDKFAEINEAYETLGDEEKRKQYDAPNPFAQNGFRFSGFDPFGGLNPFDDFEMFTGRPRRNSKFPRAGDDMILVLNVKFMESMEGCTKRVRVEIEDNCDCDGGCEKCDYTGRTTKQITLEVKVPRGCPNGQRLRVTGQGNRGYNGGPNGDIYFSVNILPDDGGRFFRDRYDIGVRVEVPYETFVLGGKIKIPTWNGDDIEYELEPFSPPGKIVTLKGRGAPVMNTLNSAGDLKAALVMLIPKDLTDKERELLQAYADERAKRTN